MRKEESDRRRRGVHRREEERPGEQRDEKVMAWRRPKFKLRRGEKSEVGGGVGRAEAEGGGGF